MHIYRVGYTSYEESPFRYLVHDVKFESDEFHQMVILAIEQIVRTWLDRPYQEDAPDDVPWGRVNRFDSLIPHYVAEYLIRERGFRNLELAAEASFDGWASIVPMDEGFPLSEDNPLNHAVTIRLVEQGLAEAIVAKNDRDEAEMMRRWDDEDGG
jgi:hypothetical protein